MIWVQVAVTWTNKLGENAYGDLMFQINLRFSYGRFVMEFFQLMLNYARKTLCSFLGADCIIAVLKISYMLYGIIVMLRRFKNYQFSTICIKELVINMDFTNIWNTTRDLCSNQEANHFYYPT